MPDATEVYLEVGSKRVFACAVDWPGWCRSGRTEEAALEALADYEDRYRNVARTAGVRFPSRAAAAFDVLERVPGAGVTDFGAPGKVPKLDDVELGAGLAARFAKLLEASWTELDRAAAKAPAVLPKGPRGGGRDTAAIVDHVEEAELSYARQVGIRHRTADAAFRSELAAALRGSAGPWDRSVWKWPPRYAARRIVWHVLDHAWEIQDKSGPDRDARPSHGGNLIQPT